MEFVTALTQLQKKQQEGIMIWMADITIKPKSKNVKRWERKICKGIVYKKKKADDNMDLALLKTLRRDADLDDDEEIIITHIERIKELGYGIYEE